MKNTSAVFVVLMVLISFHGESCKLTLICKDEQSSRTPFPCSKPECDQFCSKSRPNGWGKCKDDERYVCQCFYMCYEDISLPDHSKAKLAANSSSSAGKS